MRSAATPRSRGFPASRQALTIRVYVVCGVLAGLAGIVLAARLDSVQPSSGLGYELDTIAAVVIGGASLSGGVGSIGGTVIGVLIIGVLRNGLNLLGVSPFIQQVVIGVVIALAVAAEPAGAERNENFTGQRSAAGHPVRRRSAVARTCKRVRPPQGGATSINGGETMN